MQIMQAVAGSQILTLLLLLHFISVYCTYHSSVLVISLSYDNVSVQILQKSGYFRFTA